MSEAMSHAATVNQIAERLSDPSSPTIGVHTMSEFVYCPRAGIISFEDSAEDVGQELAPSLQGLPTHDIDRIRESLERRANEIKFPIAVLFATTLVLVLLWSILSVAAIVFLIPLYYEVRWLRREFSEYQFLRGRLQEAEQAARAEPNWLYREIQPINWWSLVRAGFTSIQKQASIEDREIGLRGKPWRVLQRGRHHFPVLRIKTSDEKHRLRAGELRPQQIARLAAYSLLLNRVERAESDWAIVLFDNSDEGIAIPLDERIWSQFERSFLEARRRLKSYLEGTDSNRGPFRESSICKGCPFGNPQRVGKPTILNGVEIVAYTTQGKDAFLYHSTCGDRFRWVPPHQFATKLQLRG